MKFRSLIAGLALSALAFSSVALADSAAAPAPAELKTWAGEYINAQKLMHDPKAEAFYQAVVDEAKKLNKETTIDEVKGMFDEMYQSSFESCKIDDNSITYKLNDGSELKVDYEFLGQVYIPEHKSFMTCFVAKKVSGINYAFEKIVLTPLHGDPQHFHFRIGNASMEELVKNPALSEWWPTCMHSDMTIEKYLEHNQADAYAKWLFRDKK